MRPITKTTICAIIAVAMAAPAFAAADFFLKFDGPIKGESSDRSAGGTQVEIESWSWGEAQSAAAANLNLSKSNRELAVSDPGAQGQKRQHAPVTFSKPLDRGGVTVKGLFRNCVAGAHYKKASLESPALRWEFTDAIITGCAADSISFNYASYRESPTRQSQK